MNENPCVSIITPLYNSSLYFKNAVNSVLEQNYGSWELILIDDKSTDDTIEKAQIFLRDSRIRLVRLETNSGSGVARNVGIEKARGRYIAFLDSDDCWLPNKLEKQVSFMQKNNVAFSYSAYEKIDKSGKKIGVVRVPEQVEYTDLLKVCSIGCLTAIYDTEKLGKVYMPLIRKRQDLGLWLRILKKIPYAYGMNEVLAQYQLRSDSISANKKEASRYTWKLYREIERLNFIKASYYFLHYAVNGILRSKLPKIARVLGKL